ncbi:MAG TPA: CvpA family protein [Patescibacteria group bacterium]|nr:CvpA family protein [Patescibacteria group bacterium]
MLLIDIVLLIILLGFIINGWQLGLLKTLGALIGIIVGIILAGHFFMEASYWLAPMMGGRENLARIVSFLAIFIIANGVIAMGIWLLSSTLKLLSFIPFVKLIDHVGGALLGLVCGVFILGILIIMLDKYPMINFLTSYFEESKIVPYLAKGSSILTPLLPEAVKQIKGVLEI